MIEEDLTPKLVEAGYSERVVPIIVKWYNSADEQPSPANP